MYMNVLYFFVTILFQDNILFMYVCPVYHVIIEFNMFPEIKNNIVLLLVYCYCYKVACGAL